MKTKGGAPPGWIMITLGHNIFEQQPPQDTTPLAGQMQTQGKVAFVKNKRLSMIRELHFANRGFEAQQTEALMAVPLSCS